MKTHYPPPADLKVEARPAPTDDIVTSEKAAADYDSAIEAWGQRGWDTVARNCRWARALGMPVDCPKAGGMTGTPR